MRNTESQRDLWWWWGSNLEPQSLRHENLLRHHYATSSVQLTGFWLSHGYKSAHFTFHQTIPSSSSRILGPQWGSLKHSLHPGLWSSSNRPGKFHPVFPLVLFLKWCLWVRVVVLDFLAYFALQDSSSTWRANQYQCRDLVTYFDCLKFNLLFLSSLGK